MSSAHSRSDTVRGTGRKGRITFHSLRHTFGTQMAAAGVQLRALQEWMGHRDFKTTLIYADYAPSAHESQMVERAFQAGAKLSETEQGSPGRNPLEQARNRAQLTPHHKVERCPWKQGWEFDSPRPHS